MMAKLKDFQVLQGSRDNKIYAFRFDTSGPIAVVFSEFKRRIPESQRTCLENEDWLWQVRATPENTRIMSELFSNFPKTINNQTEMF